MLDIKIICVGKLKEKFYTDAMAEYSKRLGAYSKFECIELQENIIGDNPSENEKKNSLMIEAKAIEKAIPKGSYVVSMCIEGKKFSSEALAETISNITLAGKSKICFIIGGSYGLSEKIKNSSDLRMSMSDMTFPHHLARIMLAEQIYRAFKINEGSHYHK